MKRRAEFEMFLHKSNKPLNYIHYCENVEKAFGGMDMDQIISSHQNISNARTKLEKTFTSKRSASNYMSGLNRYLEFSVDAASKKPVSHTISTTHFYHVARGKGVALTPDVAFVAQVLEQEYASILQFAQMLLRQGNFDYIPVIISDETPIQDGPEEEQSVTGRFFWGPKPYIEIYYRNIKSGDAARLRNCLAHEYLHYLHYMHAKAEYDNANKNLKEALADFFAVLYSIHRHNKDDLAQAKARYATWRKFENRWPYAFALYLYSVHGREMTFSTNYKQYEQHGCIGKFIQIFLSTTHPGSAYDSLIRS